MEERLARGESLHHPGDQRITVAFRQKSRGVTPLRMIFGQRGKLSVYDGDQCSGMVG